MRLVPIAALTILLLTSSCFSTEPFMYKYLPVKEKAQFESNLPKTHKREPYVFYLFSSGVPKRSFLDHLAKVSKLRESDQSIHSVQLVRGIDGDFGDYLVDLLSRTSEELWFVKESVRIKPHVHLSEELNITKVPAVVVADCTGDFLHDCNYRYIVRGDVSLDEVLRLADEAGDQDAEKWLNFIYDEGK